MEKLKELLGEELFNQVATKIGDKKLLVDDGSFIPKHRFDEKVSEAKSLKEQVQKYEADVAALKPLVVNNETLSKQIAELEAAGKKRSAELEASQVKVRKTFAVKEALMNAGVMDAEARDLLSMKFDVEKVELDDKGQPKGFEESIKPLKENPAFKGLFGTVKMKGQEHNAGDLDISLGEYAKNNPFSKSTRNIQKQIELRRTNPELADRLEKSAIK